MDYKVLMTGVMNIVAGHHFYIQVLGQLVQAPVDERVPGQTASLQLNIEILPAQNTQILPGSPAGLFILALQYKLVDFTLPTTG
jgi:hypothetical protein